VRGDRADRRDPPDRHREEERDHDDRLRAARRARGGPSSRGGDLPGVPAPVPADHDDDDGGAARRAAAGPRHRCALRASPAARRLDRGRPDREPGADALHHAGHLPRLRRPGAPAPAAPGAAGAGPGARVSFSTPFIRRPVATTLLTIGLFLAGALAYPLLPVSSLPQVDFPTISVQANLPGASPETMATSVATPLERQFGRIAGVTEMTSTSFLGASSIVLQFDLNRNIDGAARDVLAAINAARGNLPAALPTNPSYRKVNPADAPIIIIALTSPTKSRGQMYDIASSILQQKLAQVRGVGQVIVGGSSLPSVRVELNPSALNKYGIALEDVRQVLAATNVNRPKGSLSDATRTSQILANDQMLRAADYVPVIVAYRHGQALRLEDVARVEDSVEDVRTIDLSDGKPAVLLVVFRQPGANIIQTVDRIYALLPELQATTPAAIDLKVVLDRTTTIRASLFDVERTLLISIALVTLVVFAFLRSARHGRAGGRRAGLAGRHLRRDVPAAVQPRQPLADGADGGHRLRGRRRDRRAREHHPPPRGRPGPPRGGAARGPRDRLHRGLDQHLADRRVHPDPPDGRHRRPALSRVRDDP